MVDRRGGYRVLVRRSGGKRPLGRRRLGWEDTAETGYSETWDREMDRIDLAWDRDKWWAVVDTVMNIRVQ